MEDLKVIQPTEQEVIEINRENYDHFNKEKLTSRQNQE